MTLVKIRCKGKPIETFKAVKHWNNDGVLFFIMPDTGLTKKIPIESVSWYMTKKEPE